MSDSPVRLVVFDLGGVIVRICRSWAEGCREAGIPFREGVRHDHPPAPGFHDLVNQYQTGLIDADAYASSLSKAMGGTYEPREIRAIHDAWLLGEYEGVADVIDRIHDAGLATAALSNTNHEHWVAMDSLPAFMKIQHRLASHLLRLHKPDPAIYRALETQLGHRGGEIVFFDDLPENIAAARQLGWRAIQIDHTGRTDVQIEKGLRSHGLSI